MVGSSKANLFASVRGRRLRPLGPAARRGQHRGLEMLEAIHEGGMTPEVDRREGQGQGAVPAHGLRPPRLQELRPPGQDPRADRRQGARHSWASPTRCSRSPEELEEIALTDDYFVERKLYPNVDFYSGIIMRAIGIPLNMFTVMFAIGRMPGWIAQWYEQHRDPGRRIGRPRQIYTGPTERDYVPIENRG